MKTLTVLILAAATLVPMGCKKVAPTNPATLAPGAYNSTDQTIYQSLMAVQASLNSLKATLTNPLTTQQTISTLKPYINQAITDYDIAEVAWQTYHAALATNPSASPAAAQTAISKVQTDLQNTPKVTP
jgi:hypothetical protein